MAHELLKDGEYTNKADLWSVGVISYMLLSGGSKPFVSNVSIAPLVLTMSMAIKTETIWALFLPLHIYPM